MDSRRTQSGLSHRSDRGDGGSRDGSDRGSRHRGDASDSSNRTVHDNEVRQRSVESAGGCRPATRHSRGRDGRDLLGCSGNAIVVLRGAAAPGEHSEETTSTIVLLVRARLGKGGGEVDASGARTSSVETAARVRDGSSSSRKEIVSSERLVVEARVTVSNVDKAEADPGRTSCKDCSQIGHPSEKRTARRHSPKTSLAKVDRGVVADPASNTFPVSFFLSRN